MRNWSRVVCGNVVCTDVFFNVLNHSYISKSETMEDICRAVGVCVCVCVCVCGGGGIVIIICLGLMEKLMEEIF